MTVRATPPLPGRSAAAPKKASRESVELGLGDNPLAGDDIMSEVFFAPARPKKASTAQTGAEKGAEKGGDKAKKPRVKGRQPLKDGRSFRLVTFSFYEEDVARLDKLLAEARKKGFRSTSRSQIVRLALRQVDITQLPDEI